MRLSALARAVPVALLLAAGTRPASAFCGFYVGGAGARLFNDASMVVLVREGTRTVLSMQNHYRGPPSRFAMVVPVPVVLQKDMVKTLPPEVFDRIDQLAAPRLVEYWEQDPCASPSTDPTAVPAPAGPEASSAPRAAGDLGVRVEARFAVGEYEVVILSAGDSLGLDTWLRQNGYAIPEGAAAALAPYVQQGMKFFVAKVDPARVTFRDGKAVLSPLRFHYDSEGFSLPVRLGLLNSGGTQDLIVHVLARDRYEAASKPNVTIPTNLDVDEKARADFPALYAALFDRTVEVNPGAVVTEYAWDAASCDPCPTPPLTDAELATLGGDVLAAGFPAGGGVLVPPRQSLRLRGASAYTLTRLHLRYRKEAPADDLVLSVARPITGGRESWTSPGVLEHGAAVASHNNFQGRYAIRHPWKGPIACAEPRRGVWGGPPGAGQEPPPVAARDLAEAKRGGVDLPSLVREDVPEIKLVARSPMEPLRSPTAPSKSAPPPSSPPAPPEATASKGCGSCALVTRAQSERAGLLALGAWFLAARTRRRRRWTSRGDLG